MPTARYRMLALLLCSIPGWGQVDQTRAAGYFQEAAALCGRDDGRLWGVSLCGPMAFVDAATHSIATNQPPPADKQPAAFGFANMAMNWGDMRWTSIVWAMIPADPRLRGRMMLHELFHRVQPQLDLLLRDGENEHLDTLEGRYWMQLEWRALAKALAAGRAAGASTSSDARRLAVRDALAFRAARRRAFPDAAENERHTEINEGLAQYTGTAGSAESPAAALADAIQQLTVAAENPSLVRTFAYPSGTAYGLLLDESSPGWTRRIKAADDLGAILMQTAKLEPSKDAESAALRYGGAELKASETRRDTARQAQISALRQRFVDGPVMVFPNPRNFSFTNAGMTPIPGAGTIYPNFRITAEWGSLEAAEALVSTDRSRLSVPASPTVESATLHGDNWTLHLSAGWVMRPIVHPGGRSGDFEVFHEAR